MIRSTVALTMMALSHVVAPMQCASARPYEQRREESPAEALWMLAERFDAQRNREARDETLRFLVQHAPGSRFAARARIALEGGAMPAHEPERDRSDAGAR
jgi:hypothetical protein